MIYLIIAIVLVCLSIYFLFPGFFSKFAPYLDFIGTVVTFCWGVYSISESIQGRGEFLEAVGIANFILFAGRQSQ